MKVGIHVELERLRIQSGVPRHIREVVGRLLQDTSFETELFVDDALTSSVLSSLPCLWSNAARTTFSWSGGLLRRLWGTIGWPPYEAFGGSADWVYLPADSYLPTRHARLAATVHDVYRLDAPTLEGNHNVSLYNRLRWRLLLSKIAARADAILTVSEFTANRLKHHFDVPDRRLHVVYNGIEDAFFDPPATSDWPGLRERVSVQKPFVVSVGGLKPKKNAIGLIDTWQQVEDVRQDLQLVLVGHNAPGWTDRARDRLDRAVVAPELSDAELSLLLDQSQLQFLPSWYEGFGMPALEALATGTPVVLSDIPAFREVVGDLGIYVDPADPSQMAEAIIASVEDSALQRRVGEQGPDRAGAYTWDACAERVKSVFAS
ncbi:glycosyltransferase family 4 protein [Salinibacter ruber]|uniref:glycosyltransferase family 4 protein n=1 Tax=Salinibacter ruber TaxID=146919 RepID=UPI002168F960|nr:glycosyltransferase family 1 protein [Salinibacter ruber]